MDHLSGLNTPQREAVTYTEGPLLIVAGAGAGKTKTLVHRIIHLITQGVDPRSILAITFTNKAAKEMHERAANMLSNMPGTADERPFIGTFHALGVFLLKNHSQNLGIPKHFTILDRADSLSLIKEALKQSDLDPKQHEPAKILAAISRNKGDMVTREEFEARGGHDYFSQILGEVWGRYESFCKKQGSLDFDDLLLLPLLMLKKDKGLREHYQNKWQYLHIDEYQDTNKVQYEMAHILTGPQGNICVVGDADQNIYSWRGANIRNILNFEKDYPNAKVVLLEENYRSTQTILTAANAIIKKNTLRKEKNLFTRNKEGELISVYEAYDETDEAQFVSHKIKSLIEEGVAPESIGVLYRANFQSRVLEEAMLSLGVPYQILGTRFFDRKEIKDIISFIRAALNPDSLSDIKRIVNVPPRGLGKATIAKLFAGQKDSLTPAMRARVDAFYGLLSKIKDAANTMAMSELIKFVLRETGIEDALKKGSEDDLERLENAKELVTLAKKYDALAGEAGVEAFLTDAALAQDQDSLERSEHSAKLMTVHAAKGLEFQYVFVTGLEEGLFPHTSYNTGNLDKERAEEERRLFYVAVTRAREKLFLSHAAVRTIFGGRQVNIPSEFFADIDSELIEEDQSTAHETTDLLPNIFFD